MMLLFISFPCTRTDMVGPAARGAIHRYAPLHQQSYRVRKNNVISNDSNLISKVLEYVLNGFCMINDY